MTYTQMTLEQRRAEYAGLQQEYEKLYDLVLRNTEYDETQIILVPLK